MSIRKEKIEYFERIVADFGRKAGREHLPWRKRGVSAYEVWVSEIMLQQTQVSRVIGYYEKFLNRFPAVASLAQVSWEEFLPYYQGLGYYARGRNMLRTAQDVVKKHHGKFPRDVENLRRLPGIGPYTAAAIMSFVYGDRHLAWDTNLHRVIGRFFFGSRRAGINESYWERALKMPRKRLNAALMDFGSALCVARPKCGACPLSPRCSYFTGKGATESPVSEKSKIQNLKSKISRVAIILHEAHKKYYSSVAGRYEPFILPRGVVSRAAIKAHFRETHGLELAVRPPHGTVKVGREPAALVNAQILLGEPEFAVFPKDAVTGWVKKHTKNGILKARNDRRAHFFPLA